MKIEKFPEPPPWLNSMPPLSDPTRVYPTVRYRYLIFCQNTIHAPNGRPQPPQYRRELFLPLVVDFVQLFLFQVRLPTTPDLALPPHAAPNAAWSAVDAGAVGAVFVARLLLLVGFRFAVVGFGIFVFVVADVAIEGLNRETEAWFTGPAAAGAAARGEARATLRADVIEACEWSSLVVKGGGGGEIC